MERMPTFLRRPVALAAALTLAAGAPLAGALSGCGGGGSSTVIGTGFPIGPGPNTLTTRSASGAGAMQLTAAGLTQAVFFSAPQGVPDSDPRLQAPVSDTRGSLTFVRGTAYQTQTDPAVSFTAPVTMTITYTLPVGVDAQTFVRTLNVYYYDNTARVFVPVTPVVTGFTTQPGVITTKISGFQGSGLYAVLSSAPPAPPAS